MAADTAPPLVHRDELSVPAPGTDERALAIGAVGVIAVLSLPTAVISYLTVGWNGVASAMIGLAFVLALFAGSALLLQRAARKRQDGIAPLVVGALIRLPLYLVSLALLSQLSWVHGRSLALATLAAVAVTLAFEMWLISRSPRMFWIDPEAVRSSAVSDSTRS